MKKEKQHAQQWYFDPEDGLHTWVALGGAAKADALGERLGALKGLTGLGAHNASEERARAQYAARPGLVGRARRRERSIWNKKTQPKDHDQPRAGLPAVDVSTGTVVEISIVGIPLEYATVGNDLRLGRLRVLEEILSS